MCINNVKGSPTVTGPLVLVPATPKPLLISIWHCGGLIVNTTGLPVLTLSEAKDPNDLISYYWCLVKCYGAMG